MMSRVSLVVSRFEAMLEVDVRFGRLALVGGCVALVLIACTPTSPIGSGSSSSGGGSSASGGTASPGGSSGDDPSVCKTYGDESSSLPRCGVRTNEIDCGINYGCTGICNRGPVCFERSDCCADSCSAWGSNTVCGTQGTLNDGNRTVVQCDKGFAERHPGFCESANPEWTCCSSTAPSLLCPPGTQCASLSGGGYCCTSATGCLGLDQFCGDGGSSCCNGLSCVNGRCKPEGFQCTAAGKWCAQGSTSCCPGLRCMSPAGGGFVCWSTDPDQQQ